MHRLQAARGAFSLRSILSSVVFVFPALLLMGGLLVGCGQGARQPEQLVLSAPASLVAGRTAQSMVLGRYPDGTTRDVTAAVSWTSDAPARVAVSDEPKSKGLIRAAAVGSAHIRAVLDGQSAEAEVFVAPAELDAVFISPVTTWLPGGATLQLSASGIYSDASVRDVTAKVLWASQDPRIATISNQEDSVGLLTAQAEGIATIMATWFAARASTQITVGPPLPVSLSIEAPSTALRIGEALRLDVAGTYSDGSMPDVSSIVTWFSSDPAVLAVSNDEGTRGLAVAKGEGLVQVTAALDGVAATVNLTVLP